VPSRRGSKERAGLGAAGAARAAAGVVLGLLARLWLATLRLHVVAPGDLPDDRPWVLAFFHGTQFPLLAWPRRRRTVVLVSHSRDGTLQAAALARQGMAIVRGSSSRGGARGLAALIRAVRRGDDAAFAVDGPRGPYGVAKDGAIVAARATGAAIVPMGSACATAWIARRAWDLFAVPLPFTRVAVVLGAAVEVDGEGARDRVERAIERANRDARAALDAGARAPGAPSMRGRRRAS